MPATSTDRSLQAAFAPLRAGNTTALNSNVGATPALLTADNTGFGVRRILLRNTHASQTLAVCLVAAGASIAALTQANGYVLAAGERIEFIVDADTRVALVGSGASTTYSAWVSDL
jgi:hypothetical protein